MRSTFKFCFVVICLGLFVGIPQTVAESTNDPGSSVPDARPNIVWIMSEDNSKHYLNLYDAGGAETPNIRSMAKSGVLFKHAFSNAPVCSVARTTLITGVYAPRAGTHYHRRIKTVRLPDGWELFPAYLRKAGYYTTNNAKEDYNCVKGDDVWDVSGRKATWRNRGKDQSGRRQPFFHVQTFTDSHESSLHFKENWLQNPDLTSDPKKVALAPFHPDTDLFRKTHARYLDRIQVIDRKVGKVLDELREAGELENTFVFYFGDHGGVLPRGKGYVYESGLHVPLVVRVPEKWKAASPFKQNTQADGFVEFVDFGPTVLNLAGVKVPSHMDGKPFLGEGVSKAEVEERNSTFGYADRMDEKYDMCRSLRVGKWKYIRNFTNFYPDGLQNNYRYEMLAYQQWRDMSKNGKLSKVQNQFFMPKAPEMLFDLEADPYETQNLAKRRDQRERMIRMRTQLRLKLTEINDLGLFPESHLVDSAGENLVAFGEQYTKRIPLYLMVANSFVSQTQPSNRPFSSENPMNKLRGYLKDDDPFVRYWALTAGLSENYNVTTFQDTVTEIAKSDSELFNRIRAAEFLGGTGKNPIPFLKQVLNDSRSTTVNLIALQAWVLMKDGYHSFEGADDPISLDVVDSQVFRRIGYLNGLTSAETRKAVKDMMRKARKRNK